VQKPVSLTPGKFQTLLHGKLIPLSTRLKIKILPLRHYKTAQYEGLSGFVTKSVMAAGRYSYTLVTAPMVFVPPPLRHAKEKQYGKLHPSLGCFHGQDSGHSTGLLLQARQACASESTYLHNIV
jgi:hypothetical protein